MSHFARSNNPNTPQRNAKGQQSVQNSTNPSRLSSGITEETNKGGYVYRPPSKLARTNPISAVQKVQQEKKQTPEVINSKIEPPKVIAFVKRTVVQSVKQTLIQTTTKTTVQQEKQVIQQVKPVVKPIVSRLNTNKSSDPFQVLGLVPPKKELPIKKQQPAKPQIIRTEIAETKKQPERKVQIKPPAVISSMSGIQKISQQLSANNNNAKSLPTLDLKKPMAFSYPKKISRRGPQHETQQQQIASQNKKAQEEQRHETPKFNRAEQQQIIKTPSNLLIGQRRNIEKAVQNQSTGNLKPTGTQSHVYVQQKPDPKSPKSVITTVNNPVDSPMKSPVSHASRYNSRNQTHKQQETTTQQQTVKSPLKRSLILAFTLNKLFKSKISEHLNQILTISHIHKQTKGNQRLNSIFQKSLIRFIKNYQTQFLVRTTFACIINIHAKNVKIQLTRSTDPKISNLLKTNRNQCAGKVLENILLSENALAKAAFNRLKQYLAFKRSLIARSEYAAKILVNMQFKKLREHFESVIQFSAIKSQSKKWLMSRSSQISQNYKKSLLRQSLAKISLYKLKYQSSSIKPNTSSKIISKANPKEIFEQKQAIESQSFVEANKQIRSKITQLENKLTDLKSNAQKPTEAELKESVKILKQEKIKMSSELQEKKNIGSQLKQKMEMLNSKAFASNEDISSLSDNRADREEYTLSLLHQIYIKLYKQSQQQCLSQQNLLSLYAIHRVQENSTSRQPIAKWVSINQNLDLKHQINLYQGNYNQQSGPHNENRKQMYRQLLEENQIVKKFIRSYIKERYMWEEVKQYVAAVINQ